MVLYVLPSDADIEQAVEDVAFFVAAMEGLSGAAADRAILPFPSHEVDPYRGLAPHVGVTSVRARALHGIGAGTARVVVASASALMPRISAPRRLLGAALDLKPGQEIAPIDLAELLVDAGFTREDPADEHGEFAVRGGIVDIFPAGESQPVRLEFVGDTIESMRRYDAATQRSVESIDQIGIVPLQDVLSAVERRRDARRLDRDATIFDYLSLRNDSRIIVSERDEIDAAAAKLVEQLRQGYEDALGAKGTAARPGRLVRELGGCGGAPRSGDTSGRARAG